MRFTLPKNAFPTLDLSQDIQSALIEEGDTVVRETIAASEVFRTENVKIGPPNWKHVSTKEGIQVFRQRRHTFDQRTTGSSLPVLQSPSWLQDQSLMRYGFASRDTHMSMSSSSGIREDSIMEIMRPPGVSLMALYGTVDGTLDDCMLGSFSPTNEAWMLRSSHMNDRLDDARILALVKKPTRQDPYRYVAVKWFAKEHPVVLKGIMQQRDFLIIESMGITFDSKGERVGYFLMHSVTLREIPELSHLGIVRGLMSFCYIFRQGGPGKVDVFCLGFFNSRGGMPNRLSVALAADSAVCCTNVVELAYIKKLRFLVKHSRNAQTHRHTRNMSRPNQCEACGKRFTKFLLPSSGMDTTCHICHLFICKKCSVSKKITVDVSETGAVQQYAFDFCVSCLMKAKQQSGWDRVALNGLETSSNLSISSGSSSACGLPPTPSTVSSEKDARSHSTYSGAHTKLEHNEKRGQP